MEKDEEIQQNQKALQSAAEEIIKLEHGRALAISVMNETQQNAAISEALANKRAEKALQSEAASHYRAQKLQEERNCAVNARDTAESRAEDAEKARKEDETRAEQAEQAKILAEERAKGLDSNQAYMISSRQQAETRAEKAEADLAAAVEREIEARRLLEVATSIDRVEAAICVRPPEKRPTNPNKGSRPSSSTAKKRREFRELEATYHDERLKDLAQDLNRVVEDWGTERRDMLFSHSLTTRLRLLGWKRGVALVNMRFESDVSVMLKRQWSLCFPSFPSRAQSMERISIRKLPRSCYALTYPRRYRGDMPKIWM
ncbi:unnamed protein product, partial [Clonostachys rosea f. rosea IK726]